MTTLADYSLQQTIKGRSPEQDLYAKNLSSREKTPQPVEKTVEELHKLLKPMAGNLGVFARTLMPHRYYRPFSPLYQTLLKALDDETIENMVLLAPRGLGKTSLTMIAKVLQAALLQGKKHIVIIGASEGASKDRIQGIKAELRRSRGVLRKIFGDIRSREIGDKYSDACLDIVSKRAGIRCRVRAVGAGQKTVRGGLSDEGDRPDLIICDDIENDENVLSQEQRDKLERWLMSAVKNSGDTFARTNRTRMIFIGTLIHHDAVIARVANGKNPETGERKYPGWHVVKISLCDHRYQTLDPVLEPQSVLDKRVGEARAAGQLSLFAREFMNEPTAGEDAVITEDMFHYYSETEEELNRDPNVRTFIVSDPTRTMKQGSCRAPVLVVSLHRVKRKIYLRWLVSQRVTTNTYLDLIWELAARFRATLIAPEVTGLEDWITVPMMTKNVEEMSGYAFYWIKAVGKKEDRACTAAPFFQSGQVVMNPHCPAMSTLQLLLLQLPTPSQWDEVDCVGHIAKVMSENKFYFKHHGGRNEAEMMKKAMSGFLPPLDHSWQRLNNGAFA